MSTDGDVVAETIRRLLLLDGRFSVLCMGVLLIGRVAGAGPGHYWVCLRADDGEVRWEREELSLEEAIEHFLRLRAEHGLDGGGTNP